jgi:hypothetical protein
VTQVSLVVAATDERPLAISTARVVHAFGSLPELLRLALLLPAAAISTARVVHAFSP